MAVATTTALAFSDLEENREIERSVDITADLIHTFGNVVGDHNPLHDRRGIAHGALVVGLTSAVVADTFAGMPVVERLHAKFLVPVRAGDTLRIVLRVGKRFLSGRRGLVHVRVTCLVGDVCVARGRLVARVAAR